MAVEVIMPKLGMAMKEGTVSQWLKGEGETVEKGEPIANINSEKIEMEIEAPADGTLIKINIQEGDGVPPGTVIGYIGEANEAVGQESESNEQELVAAAVAVEPADNQLAVSSVTRNPRKQRARISPAARKLAKAAKLDLENLQGTGPGGRITKEDVQEAIKSIQQASEQQEVQGQNEALVQQEAKSMADSSEQIPVIGMRKVIATRMYESLQTSAQLTMTMKVDVTSLTDLQAQTKESVEKRYEKKLTLTDFITRAVVLALQEHPEMNSAYIDEKIQVYQSVHLGIAVALKKGLVVPVIRQAENSSLIELSKQIKELAEKARNGGLSNEEMKGSTFTISSLGGFGVEYFTPILNPPETGILGVGATEELPVYIGENLVRRKILPLSLTFDHRVLDGAPAAAFLQTVKQYLEEPITMLI